MTSLAVSIVDNGARFEAMRAEWTELLADSESASLFLTWEWLYTWWKHFAQERPLFIVTVRDADQLIAIAPLTISRSFGVPVFEFAGTGIIGSDYLDVIVRRGRESEAIEALTALCVVEDIGLRLPRVGATSATALAFGRQLERHGWKCTTTRTEVCPYINLTEKSFDDYLLSVGSSHRYNFRRRLRNLTKQHEISLRCAATDGERREFLAILIDLHLQRWTRRGGSDAFTGERVLAFHEEFSALALSLGWLRLSLLTAGGTPAAAFLSFRYGDSFLFYQSGFNTAFERDSAGLVMMGLTIRDAIAEGASEFDFLHGDESYKSLWTRTVRPLVRLDLYPPGPIGSMHRNAARVKAATKRLLRGQISQ